MKKINSLFVFVVVLLSGCSAQTYHQEGSAGLASEKLAEVFLPDPVNYGAVIDEIDGRWRGVGLINRYFLLPGKRCITFGLNRAFYTGKNKLVKCFIAEPGTVYSPKVEIDYEKMRWNVFIINYKTNENIPTVPASVGNT